MNEPEVRLHDVSIEGGLVDRTKVVAAIQAAATSSPGADQASVAEAVSRRVAEAVTGDRPRGGGNGR